MSSFKNFLVVIERVEDGESEDGNVGTPVVWHSA